MLSSNLPQILDGPTPRLRSRRTLKKEARPALDRAASNRRDHAKIASKAQRRGGQNRPFLYAQAPVLARHLGSGDPVPSNCREWIKPEPASKSLALPADWRLGP